MFYHEPIMVDKIIVALQVQTNKLYFDGTLGSGGHSLGILKRGGKILATDLDHDAIEYATNLFESSGYAGNFTLVRSNFKKFIDILDERGIDKIDGALLDLGVSSHQLDEAERGFSYRFDAKLDMRMDQRQQLTAEEVINNYSPEKLLKILYEYGEESFAKRIVNNIVKERNIKRIETTSQLASLIERSVPHRKGGHPAKQTFQALRIEVNGELDGLGQIVEDIFSRIKVGGRLCVLAFHSLEDRIIKRKLKIMAMDCLCDKSIPVCVCGHKAEIKIIKVGLKASDKEQEENKRSHSASLRVAEKL